jgi:hypothetical protein
MVRDTANDRSLTKFLLARRVRAPIREVDSRTSDNFCINRNPVSLTAIIRDHDFSIQMVVPALAAV